MASSRRNELGMPNGLSQLEARFPFSDDELFGAQPWGVLDGRNHEINSEHLWDVGRNWIVTTVDTDTGDTNGVRAIQAATKTEGPFLRLTSNDNDADSEQIQFARGQTASTTSAGTSTAHAPFIVKAGYDIECRVRFRINTTTANAVVFFGLAPVDTTVLPAHVIGITDALGFYKAASATMGGIMRKSSTSTTTAVTSGGSAFTPTTQTWYTAGFRLTGLSGDSSNAVTAATMQYFINGERTNSSTITNIPLNTTLLTPTIAVASGTAAVATLDISGIYFHQEMR